MYLQLKIGEKPRKIQTECGCNVFLCFFCAGNRIVAFVLFISREKYIELKQKIRFSYIYELRMIENENERKIVYIYFDFDMNL